ncbi:MAG: lipopolysaccharide heptosyltransferase II [Nitrospiraceae bacterium]
MRIESVKRLVVRGPNWVGDAVMCEPALSALRGLFPTAEITLLVKPTIAELLGNHPGLDRILVYDSRRQHAGLTGKWALARALHRLRFDLAVLFQNAFEAALLAFLARIPRRYGYATDGRSLLLTDPIGVPERARGIHQVEYYLELIRPLGAAGPSGSPRLFLSDSDRDAMRRRLAQAGIGETDLVVGLNPGSTYGMAKRWLPERFAETADRLVREHGGKGLRVVIVGARGEEALGRAIAERMQAKPVLLSGQTSLRELMAVISRCGLFVTNDTGPMHIAAAFGIPVVAVFGPTDSRTTAPTGDGHIIVRHPVECSPCLLRECPIDHRCMTRVSVDDVFDAAVKQLSSVSGSSRVPRSSGTNHMNQTNQTTRLDGVTIFMDRDGTLNRDTGYVKTPEELELFPGVVEAVARLNQAGARVVLTTNQSGVARGLFTTAALDAIHARLRALLEAGGASLDAIYYCPHHPDDACSCRKPQTGLVDRAVSDLGLDPSRAYVVGDQNRDMELARRIGARSVLVTTGPTSQEALTLLKSNGLRPDRVATGLEEAVDWILEDAATMEDRQLSLPESRQW